MPQRSPRQKYFLKCFGIFPCIILILAFFIFYFHVVSSVQAATLIGQSTYATSTSFSNGLVGYWTFNNQDLNWATGKVFDKSGLGNTGSMIGMATTTASVVGKIGQALKFNGSTGYIQGTNVSALNDLTTLTVSVWVNVSNLATNRPFIAKSDNSSGGHGWDFGIDNGTASRVYFIQRGYGPTDLLVRTNTGTLTAGSWQHYVVTWNGSNLSSGVHIYKNGAETAYATLQDGTAGTPQTDAAIATQFARGTGFGSSLYEGALDDMRIYNRVMTPAEVKMLYLEGQTIHAPTQTGIATTSPTNVMTYGLVGYWPMNNQDISWTTGKVFDRSGNSNSGSIVGMSTTSSSVQGIVGQALRYSNSTTTITASSAINDIAQNKSLSISTWIYPTYTDTTLGHVILDKNIWRLQTKSNIVYFNYRTSGNWARGNCASIPIAMNKWNHVVISGYQGGTTFNMYINGKLCSVANGLTGSINSDSASNLLIGNTFGFDFSDSITPVSFTGYIDEVRMFSKALSASDVTQLFKAGQTNITFANSGYGTTLSSSLIGYWTFNNPDMNWATGKAVDKSNQGNDGLLVSMSTSTSPAPGKVGQGLNFNGSTSYVNVSSLTSDTNFSNKTFTVTGWAKKSGNTYVISKDGTSGGWAISFSGSGSVFALIKTSGTQASRDSVSTIANGTWVHFAVIFTTDTVTAGNNNIQIYVNGVLNQNSLSAASAGYVTNSSQVLVGKRGAGENFNGVLDDIRIYSRGLSATEIKSLYSIGR
jgi:hypothetical protein